MNSNERERAPGSIWAVETSNGTWVQTWPAHARENGGIEYIRADLAATRMREACVAKLDSLARHVTNELVCAALGMAARSLESLTLDQVVEKQ